VDRATYLTYRDAYFAIAGRESDRRFAARALRLRAKLRVFARSFSAQLRANRGLSPPSHLRSLHRGVLRGLARVVREFDELARGIVDERRRGDLDRYERLEDRLLRELRLSEER
jgi:hypothetical protein